MNTIIISHLEILEEWSSIDNYPYQKRTKVQQFFNSIALKYDFVNTVISLGRDHYWRKFTAAKAEIPPGGKTLDICCGTGLLTMELAKKSGIDGDTIGLDFSESMLAIAQQRYHNSGMRNKVTFIVANADKIPFPEQFFDCVVIAYGLRNIPNYIQAISEIKRVLKPGGRFVSLEMGKPNLPIFREIYYLYLHYWVPLIGMLFTHVQEAYQYFYRSVISFIHPEELTRIYQELGFEQVCCYKLTGGVVAVHRGINPSHEKFTAD